MKPLIYLPGLMLMACGTTNSPSADTVIKNRKDTACQQPESKADQEARRAVREAELRSNQKMKKETN